MQHIDTVIIGGGQAGLALSRSLTDRSIEHVVLERGRIGERWRSERWDSLRLLTPNWMSRLPGYAYDGNDPDGYMMSREVVGYLERYAQSFTAPVEQGVAVLAVKSVEDGYRILTDRGSWKANNVVIATGDCDKPFVPAAASDMDATALQVVPSRYRRPDNLPEGGVLVVGASATGVQLASEIHASGRPVTLAVGRHIRLPRTYRGQDILWWLERMGILHERAEDVRDLDASRSQPSLQLVGTPDRQTLDLRSVQAQGVRLVGRVEHADGCRLDLGDNLLEDVVGADVKLARMRIRIDRYATTHGLDGKIPNPPPFDRFQPPETPERLDLKAEGIKTVLWATGFRRSYPWLHVPVIGKDGEIVHQGGVTPSKGLYVMGLRFLRRRSSTFIDGQAKDAVEIADYMMAKRKGPQPAAA